MEDQVIGGCGLTVHSISDKRAEIGYCIRREDWGKGVGTEVAAGLLNFGFVELKMHRIEAKCDPDNIASYKVMEKNGMRREGILREEKKIRGEWRDSYIYSILENDWSG
jgi:RimJ/RimL family protein N-acetyltransferase